MSVTFEPVAPERDRFGRPMVRQPDGSTVAYTRCTTFVSALEDTYNLSQWQQRMVAAGLAARPDLLLRASSLGPEPESEVEARRWKGGMAEVCEKAIEAAKGSAKATIGTALHALTETRDRGLPLGPVPEAYQPHLRAYEVAMAGIEPVHIERFCVLDELQIGGTPDRVLRVGGRLVIGDIKTGNVSYGVGKIAMQLAVYARSALYDAATGERTSLGEVDTDEGLVIALDARSGECRLLWIDLAAGWQAVQLAREVRRWRANRKLTRPHIPADLTLSADVTLRSAIAAAPTPGALVDLWRRAGSVWTAEHTDLAAQRKSELAAARPSLRLV